VAGVRAVPRLASLAFTHQIRRSAAQAETASHRPGAQKPAPEI